ncbi:tail fiber assembly protein [Pseudomonas guariconensis]|uniref:tail fiber assembly protein n=1 Tax=Pseudomonas guariconensis TaxID=1288410 RepID=UPI0036711FF6
MTRAFYRNPVSGEVYEFEPDGSQDSIIPSDLVAMTLEEIDAHLHPMPTYAELLAVALAERDQFLSIAAIRIAPLQDAVDLGEASAAEEQALVAWKRYRVAVNRIDQQVGFPGQIDWPAPPA